MALEQQMEQSEELLETNERNKERVEDARDHVRQAGNRVSAAQAQLQYAYSQLQQARADRAAAAQQASQEEGGSVSSSYDAAVAAAEAEVSAANRELQESRREQMEAETELRNAEGDLAESSRELRSVADQLQQVSEKYGLNLSRTSQLLNLPHSQLASPLLQQLGIGKGQVDDLRQRIAASLGIAMVATGGSYGGFSGGYSGSNRQRATGGGGSYGGGSSGGGFSSTYPNIRGGGIASAVSGSAASIRANMAKNAAASPTPEPPQQKQGIISRIFGKKNSSAPSGKTFSGYNVDPHGFVHGSNHQAFLNNWEGYDSNNFVTTLYDRDSVIQNISAESIEGINVSEHDIEEPEAFWSQHEREGTKESFVEIASHIPEVQSALDSGRSLSDLLEDDRLGMCASLYFDPAKMTEVMDCGDYYEFQSNGRHRILAARELGYDIPVKIIGSRKRK